MKHQPIVTALLSYGMSGEVFHGPLLSVLPEFHLKTIVQRNSDKARQHFPGVNIVRNVDAIFDDGSIELVIINTPNETHFDFAMKALASGKHIVVEKPFTVTSAEAQLLMEASVKYNRLLTVFQNRRWDGDFLTVQKIISEKHLGKIVEFEAHYDRFRNYVEANTWKEEVRPGTGILYNLGSHMLDQVLVLFGMPLYLDARLGIQRPGGMVDDFYDIRLEYPDHLVIVKSSYLVKEPMPRYMVHGVNGSFVKFGIDPQEQALKEKLNPLSPDWGEEPEQQWGKLNVIKEGSSLETKVKSESGKYLQFYHNLFDAIRNGAVLKVKAEEARNVIRLIEACSESNKKKCAIKIM
jgi:scyllo-inositol 2-dehydrogenase (NADP+)